jgi:hypothetical protein
MSAEQLRATVAELERQLSAASTLDPKSREALEQALEDIRAALQDQGSINEQGQSLTHRLRDAAERFGGAHPTLTGTLMRLIDGLGEMGI